MSGKAGKAAAAVVFAVGLTALAWALRPSSREEYTPAARDTEYWRRRAEQPDDSVRVHAFKELGQIGDPAGAAVLIQAAQSDKNGFIRAAATESLGGFGAAAPLPVLKTALTDKDRRVTDAATIALAKVKTPEAQAVLTAAIDEKDDHKTVMVIIALPAFRNARTEDTLIGLLNSRSAWVRWRSIVALGRVGTVRCVPRLQALRATPLARTDYDPGPDKGMAFLDQQIGEMLSDAITAASQRPPWPDSTPSPPASGGTP